jgi:hypothetical protein
MFTRFSNKPLIVYLDQNKWIDLAKASVGHIEGLKYQKALEQVVLTSKQEKAIFPLSLQHFMETRKQSNPKKRKDLALVMEEISRGATIAPKRDIMPSERQREIALTFDMQPMPMRPVFGYGLSIIFAKDFLEKKSRFFPRKIGVTHQTELKEFCQIQT